VYRTSVTSDDVAHEAVRQVHEAWLAAELSGDIEGILTLCTSDVRWLAPDSEMVVGRDAGRRLLTNTQVELESIVASDVHVEISRDLAFKTSRYERAIGYVLRRGCTLRGAPMFGSFGARERCGAWHW
jgi:ketosteroid isomerase-like protein